MPHFTSDAVFDVALNEIKNNANLMVLTQGAPNNYADANTANGSGTGQKMAEVAMAAGDYVLANGDTSGRKVTCAAKATVNVDTAGDGDHVAYLDTVGLRLLHYYALATARPGLLAGDKVNFPAHDFEIRDTVAE